ncbi:TetR/AcrR family transcriptional regulator [Streptomyces phytohabitans]|uniref:TetR/AcrR family transcriptional regulator n=1 Tax=Streptomyces phytohabitans TaxID=1150371 RepID=UPI00345B8E3F
MTPASGTGAGTASGTTPAPRAPRTPRAPRDAPRRRPNRRGEGRLLRADILAAATELLDADGDERAVTLRAVARRAGISAPSIYPHYLDRPALVRDVVRQAFAALADDLRAAHGAAGGDPSRRLHAVCRAYLAFAHDHPERYRVMFGGAWHPVRDSAAPDPVDPDPATPHPADPDAAPSGGEATRLLADCLDDCVAAGCCASTDPAADAVALWLGLHGLAHQRAVSDAFAWPDDIVRRLASPLSHLV